MRNLSILFVLLAAIAAGVGCASHASNNSAADADAWKPGHKPTAGYAAIVAHSGAAGASSAPATH